MISGFRAIRYVFYPLLFACSTVLLGLTAYRIHYTKRLSGGDILTSSSHFYDPRIVALLVASILSLLFSLVILGMIGGSVDVLVAEHIGLWVIWIFFLITAALVTNEWSNLRWCRAHFKVCRILETIKAFSWICWGLLSFLLIVTLIDLVLGDRRDRGSTRGAFPDTRETTVTTTAIHDQPRTQVTTAQDGPAAQGLQTPPGLKTTPGIPTAPGVHDQGVPDKSNSASRALYAQAPVATGQVYVDHPVHAEPRHLV